MGVSGQIIWPNPANPIWQLNWRLADSPDEEGLVIRNAYFRGRQVFYKASLPILRVQYDGNHCGPYKDPLNYNNAQTTSRCPNDKVCVYQYTSNGVSALALESYHRIGSYRLTHRWVFWEDGVIYPRLFSAGLQCPHNHRHHAYWRFDFDIEGAGNDLALEYNDNSPNNGWGIGWHVKKTEIRRVKNPPTKRSWAILDKGTQRGYHLLPGSNDGTADSFSKYDLWLLRYAGGEDRQGRQGDAWDDGLASYVNGDIIDGSDVVVWYAGHLSHEAHAGGDEWHSTGPTLVPFSNWDRV